MNNIKSYEAIAREAGFRLRHATSGYYWVFRCRASASFYNTQEEAWKACCEENSLL